MLGKNFNCPLPYIIKPRRSFSSKSLSQGVLETHRPRRAISPSSLSTLLTEQTMTLAMRESEGGGTPPWFTLLHKAIRAVVLHPAYTWEPPGSFKKKPRPHPRHAVRTSGEGLGILGFKNSKMYSGLQLLIRINSHIPPLKDFLKTWTSHEFPLVQDCPQQVSEKESRL